MGVPPSHATLTAAVVDEERADLGRALQRLGGVRGSEDEQRGRERVRAGRVGRPDGHRETAAYRPPRPRIEDVARGAPTLGREVALVVAGGGHGLVGVEREDAERRVGIGGVTNRDAPAACGPVADERQVAAEIEDRVAGARGHHGGARPVEREALGDPAEVDAHAGAPEADRLLNGIEEETAPPDRIDPAGRRGTRGPGYAPQARRSGRTVTSNAPSVALAEGPCPCETREHLGVDGLGVRRGVNVDAHHVALRAIEAHARVDATEGREPGLERRVGLAVAERDPRDRPHHQLGPRRRRLGGCREGRRPCRHVRQHETAERHGGIARWKASIASLSK